MQFQKVKKVLELAEIGGMVKAGAIAISDDGIPVKNSYLLRNALEYAKKFNIPVINHAEDSFLVNDGQINEGEMSVKLGLLQTTDITESSMVFRDLSIADFVGGTLHVPHISSYKSVELIKKFKQNGLNVTAEVTPHHLCLTEDILKNYDTNAKVAPRMDQKDRDLLVEAVKDGIIDCIATDHAPHAIEDKEKDFCNASCGMIGLESAFGLVNKTLSKIMSKESIIDLFTLKPSEIINVKPSNIEENNIAELNVIDFNCEWVFDLKDIFSKSHNTPIIGQKLLGKVIYTVNKVLFL